MKNFTQTVISKTAECLKMYCAKNNTTFDPQKAKQYMQKTIKGEALQILETVQKDMKDAGFGLQTKNPTRLQLDAGEIAFIHACTLYAKKVYEASKVE